MSDLGFNVLGAITGVIGVFAVLPVIACWLYRRGPTFRLRILDQLLKETESEFDLSVQNGLLHSGNGLHRLSVKLWSIQLRVDDVRGEVYAFRSWWEDVCSWWRGTSRTIDMLCEELNEVRVDVALNSSREKRALAATGYLNKLANCSNGFKGEHDYPALCAPV
ncbi:hypothetical protein NUW54_g7970 [Trametes sanguinea]|uniref:Uncharacterized protein n=1 Tax=Trametes sanguinea TaxID=158606 RepID=A0ACC1PI05_9APHY|nr:hypothetical protein NUW54_g7970 [Trametes sanguinea]